MEFVEYGDKNGSLAVYFHGTPGSIEECAIFDKHAKERNLKIISFDRLSLDASHNRENYCQQIANQIEIHANGEPINLIGFSIGASVALEVGKLLGSQVRQTHLVSSVAPIRAGDFIGHMAGGLVFKLAMEKPFIFTLFTQCQRLMALFVPRILVNMLFASAAGKDKELNKQQCFKNYITPVLSNCFKNRTNGYIRDICWYVTWPGKLDKYTSSVKLWHGTDDNWSPVSMALYLSNAIPGAARVEAMEGLSHYSCLYEAAPKICAQL